MMMINQTANHYKHKNIVASLKDKHHTKTKIKKTRNIILFA